MDTFRTRRQRTLLNKISLFYFYTMSYTFLSIKIYVKPTEFLIASKTLFNRRCNNLQLLQRFNKFFFFFFNSNRCTIVKYSHQYKDLGVTPATGPCPTHSIFIQARTTGLYISFSSSLV